MSVRWYSGSSVTNTAMSAAPLRTCSIAVSGRPRQFSSASGRSCRNASKGGAQLPTVCALPDDAGVARAEMGEVPS